MPARSAVEDKSFHLIADLDELIADVYQLKVLGKTYELKPIVGHQMRALDQACMKTLSLGQRISQNENVPYDEIVKTYHEFCKLVIPELKISDLNEMTVKQINELLKVCFRFATQQELKSSEEDPQKKNPLN